jgi:hypothetical protein
MDPALQERSTLVAIGFRYPIPGFGPFFDTNPLLAAH